MKRITQIVDATLKSPGRVATEVAHILMGKNKPTFSPHLDNGDAVEVINIAGLKLNKKKLANTEFFRHTLHPGGLKRTLAKDYTPTQLVRMAVKNMLPKNTLRDKRIKRLTIR